MVKVKGTGFRASVDWIKRDCDDAQWRSLLQRFEEHERAIILELQASDEYPITLANKLYRAYASVKCLEDRDECRAAFLKMGRHIAESDLSGVYKVAISWMSTAVLARFLPRQWQLYFPGVDVQVEELDVEARRVVNVVRGLGGFSHISPVAAEWMKVAFESVGESDVVVTESSYDAGAVASDELRYEITWA